MAAAATTLGLGRFATPAQAQTKHIRLYVEMDVAAGREKEMLDAFHNTFVPEAVKHDGYIRVKMLKRRSVIQGTAAMNHNYRFELEFESEDCDRSGLRPRSSTRMAACREDDHDAENLPRRPL